MLQRGERGEGKEKKEVLLLPLPIFPAREEKKKRQGY